MFVDYASPGLSITRIRFNGYNLSLLLLTKSTPMQWQRYNIFTYLLQ